MWMSSRPRSAPFGGLRARVVSIASVASVLSFAACVIAPPSGPGGASPQGVASGSASAQVAMSQGASCAIREAGFDVLSSADPSIGPPDAPVTIVEFSDLQCRFCKRAQGTIDDVIRMYGNRVRVVWKHQPLQSHKMAIPAALLAQGIFELGGATPFWTFVHKVFDAQGELTEDRLIEIANETGGVDMRQLDQGLTEERFSNKVVLDMALAEALQSDGTPHFFINGTELSGAKNLDRFREVIDAELALATANGTQNRAASMEGGCDRLRTFLAKKIATPPPTEKAEKNEEDDNTIVWKVPVAGSPTRGPDTALVTVVVFSDYECPYCKRAETTLDALRTKYGSKIRFVWKDAPLPFHANAEPAAQLAREAKAQKGDAGFWAAHDAIFASSPKLDRADLIEVAKAQGLSTKAVEAALDSHKHKSAIDSDGDVGDDFAVRGTPHFFINGRRLVGAQKQEKFEEIVDAEIAKAQALIASGTPASKVYEKTVADGRTPPPFEMKTIAVPTDRPVRGAVNAKVTVQVFADFQCPFCEKSRKLVDQMIAAYPTSVRVMWRQLPLPFHDNAMLAAEATEEAFAQGGNTAFWKMHDQLFDHQKSEHGLERAALEEYAAKIGLDMKRFKAALDGHTHQAKIKADMADAEKAEISGTPSFMINGIYVSGAQRFVKFRKAIDQSLKTR